MSELKNLHELQRERAATRPDRKANRKTQGTERNNVKTRERSHYRTEGRKEKAKHQDEKRSADRSHPVFLTSIHYLTEFHCDTMKPRYLHLNGPWRSGLTSGVITAEKRKKKRQPTGYPF